MSDDFAFMDIEIDDAQELGTVDGDDEYTVEIVEVTPTPEKSYVILQLRIQGAEMTKQIWHYLTYPKSGDNAEKINNKKLRIKRTFEAFDIQSHERTSFNLWMGRTARAVVGLEESEDYGKQNRVKKWVTPGA